MNKEKTLVVWLIAGFIAMAILSCVSGQEPKDLVRLAIFSALSWFLYRGANWSRWIMGAIAAISGLVAFLFLYYYSNNILYASLFTLMVAFYWFAAYVLLTGKMVRAHFIRQ